MPNYTAGTAYLRISPSMTGFTTALRTELKDIKPVLGIRIKPVWTTTSTQELRNAVADANPKPVVNVRIRPQWTSASRTELRDAVNGVNPKPSLDLAIKPQWTSWSAAQLRAALAGITPPPSMDVRINPVWNGGTFPPIPDQEVNVRAKVDRNSITGAINAFATLARSMAYLTLGGGVLAALPVLGALAGAAVAASGALLLIPAAGVAAGLAIGGLKVGMSGFSDTLKEADPAKFAEALAKLSPAARDAALAIRGLAPAWTAIKLDVQDALFRSIGDYIREMSGTYLPILRQGLLGAAEGFNLAAGGAMDFLASQQTIDDTRMIFDNSNISIKTMAGSMDAMLRIFRDVAAVGSTFLPGLATGWADAAHNASIYVSQARESGRLAEIIQGGLDALSQLGQLFSNIGAIIGTVWRAAGEAGHSFLQTMIDATREIGLFLNSANGYGALVTIFETLRAVTAALLPGIIALANGLALGIQILGPALAPIAAALSAIMAAVVPLIAPLAVITASLGQFLAAALQAVAPLVQSLAQVIGDILLAALRAIEPLFPIIVDSLGLLVPPLVEVAKVIGGALIQSLDILAPALPPLMQAIGNLAVALGPLVVAIVRLASEILVALMPVVPPLIDIFTRFINEAIVPLIPPLVRIIEALIPGMVATINVLTPVISFLASVLTDVLVWAVNSLVIPAFELIASTLEWLNGAWSNAAAVVDTTWRSISQFISDAWNGVIKPVWDTLVAFIQGVLEVAFNVLWTTVRIAIGAIAALIELAWRTIIKPIWDELVAFVNTVLAPMFTWLHQNIVAPAWEGIRTAIQVAYDWVKINVFDPIVNFFNGVLGPAFVTLQSTATTQWNTLRDSIGAAYNATKAAVFDPLANLLTVVIPDAFRSGVSIVTSVWDQIKKALRDPIQAVITTVYNGGIVASWNRIADFVGLPGQKLADFTLPQYAKGGPVRGRQIAELGEEGPEYVLSAPAVRNLGGLGAVDTLHKAAREKNTFRALQSGQIVEGADHEGAGWSTVGFGGVKPWVAKAGHQLRSRFGIGTVGGVGSRPNASDHPRGLALDFMTSGENGTQLAQHVIANKGHYGVTYAIWRQQINNGSGWRGMEDRGSPTANHMDHVHVSFTGAAPGGGTGNTGGLNGGAGGGFSFDPVGWVMGMLPNIGDLLGKITGFSGGAFEIAKGFGGKIFGLIKDFAVKKATAAADRLAAMFGFGGSKDVGAGGAGVERWRSTVVKALQIVNQPLSNTDLTLRRMNQESSGNPNAINRTDSNWQRGTPSVGLMQVIGPTFRAHAGQYVNTPPQEYGVSKDPLANIYASMRYALSRYGSLASAYNRPGGYDRGGLARGAGWISKGPMPERILNGRQTRAFEQLVEMRNGVSFGTRLTVDRPDGISASSAGGGESGGPLIGTLVVPTPEGAGVQETIDAVMTRARHEARSGGRYGRRG